MNEREIVELVNQLAATDISRASVDSCTEVLQGLCRVVAWAEAHKITIAQRLAALAAESPAVSPEHVLANATRVSLGEALQPFKRGAAIDALPQFGDALADGAISVAHVDVLAGPVKKLGGDDRQRFLARGDFLTGVAQRSTPGEFARSVHAEVLRSQRGDGLERLRRQKQNTFLKTWTDQTSGMFCIRGEFDPETGATLHNRLTRTIEKLFHDSTPDTAPSDPIDKQHHPRALALVALTDGTGAAPGGIDMSILIDSTTLFDGPHDATIIDCGLPIDLPIETIRRMACCAEITPIIVGADGVSLHLGATTRLANRAQRRALRAMYRTCAVPGCCVAWDKLVVHHVKWFRHCGPTDIENLLPICIRHHHYAHEGQWQLQLAPDHARAGFGGVGVGAADHAAPERRARPGLRPDAGGLDVRRHAAPRRLAGFGQCGVGAGQRRSDRDEAAAGGGPRVAGCGHVGAPNGLDRLRQRSVMPAIVRLRQR